MNGKEFFRFKLSKFLVFLSLSVIAFIFFMYTIGCGWQGCSKLTEKIVLILGTPFLLGFSFLYFLKINYDLTLLRTILELIYLYLLSCIIIYFYNKWKNRNSKTL